MVIKVDGSKSLKDQENSIGFTEEGGPFQLTALTKSETAPKNDATFVDLPFGQEVKQLILIEVTSANLPAVKTAQEDQGKKFICQSDSVFVNGALTGVAAFR